MPSILHISDLHRTSEPRLNNDELLSAIASDARRWEQEDIAYPDIIVVSGDLVQGASLDSSDSDAEISAQYDEADAFLRQLATEFVDSDRSRLVIVPGNHDVHWSRARRAMNRLDPCPDGIEKKVLKADSNIRWNWKERQAYEIVDQHLYESRYEQFRQFRANFYAGLDPSPLPCGNDGPVFADHQPLGIAVAGFASWYGNDCFCHVGEIDSKSLASSRKLLDGSDAPVAVAVWHHSVVGGPRVQDYMDQQVIHKLIDFGFNVGLHGHQHYPGVAPYELHLPNKTSMVVVGAGSLAVGNSELPMGESRQFNVVVINPDRKSVTVHVRAMSHAGVFTGSHRNDFGGNTYIKLRYQPSPMHCKSTTPIQQVDEAMNAVAEKQYERALELAADIDLQHAFQRRQVEIRAFEGLGRLDELIMLLDPPQSVDEVVRVISLLLDANRFDEAHARLEASLTIIDTATYNELASVITTRRMIS